MALMDFSIDTSGTPQDVQRKQALADALMKQGMDSTPAAGGKGGGWITALNRGLAGALGGYQRGVATNEERQGRDSVRQQLAAALQGNGGKIDPQTMIGLASNPWALPAQTQTISHIADMQRQESRDKVADQHWSASYGLQKRAADRADDPTPDGFVKQPDGTYAPLPGGPQDPAYLASATAAKAKAKAEAESGGQGGIVTGPDGAPITIPPGVDRDAFVKAVSTDTAHGMAGKFTETQGKANQFATRMENAEKTLGKLDEQGTSLKGAILNSVPGGNYVQSKDYQNYRQAQQEFITALLRRESGAAIAQHEFDNYGKQFFPQPGDGPEVIAQKRQARWNALNSMKSEAGPAYKGQKQAALSENPSANAPEERTIGDKTYVKKDGQWFEK